MDFPSKHRKGISKALTIILAFSFLALVIAGYYLSVEKINNKDSFDFPEDVNETSINNFSKIVDVHHSSLLNKSYTIQTVNGDKIRGNYTLKKEGNLFLIDYERDTSEGLIFVDNENMIFAGKINENGEEDIRRQERDRKFRLTGKEYSANMEEFVDYYEFKGIEEVNSIQTAKYEYLDEVSGFNYNNNSIIYKLNINEQGIIVQMSIVSMKNGEEQRSSSLEIKNIGETEVERPSWVEE